MARQAEQVDRLLTQLMLADPGYERKDLAVWDGISRCIEDIKDKWESDDEYGYESPGGCEEDQAEVETMDETDDDELNDTASM